MRLPAQKKISKEDMKEAPKWVDSMIGIINSFMESVYQALNKNITFQENIASFIKEITYVTGASYPGTAHEVVTFQSSLKAKPIGVQAIQVVEKSNYSPPPGPVWVPWTESNDVISIGSITGLEASKSYTIRLLVF